MAKKRERLEVIHDILMAMRDSGHTIKPTRLQYASNLSPQMFRDYVAELEEKGFIEMVLDKKSKKLYRITVKGLKFLEEYKVIVQFIDNFGL